MNIIENVWFHIKSRLSKAPIKPHNVAELKHMITEIWYSIPVDYIQSLYHSIGERLTALELAKGGYTRF